MKKDNLSFYERELEGRSVSIVGVPIELGSDERGHAKAPHHLLEQGLEKVIAATGSEVADIWMVPCPKPAYTASAGSDRKSTRLNSSHMSISYAVFCLQKIT